MLIVNVCSFVKVSDNSGICQLSTSSEPWPVLSNLPINDRLSFELSETHALDSIKIIDKNRSQCIRHPIFARACIIRQTQFMFAYIPRNCAVLP